MDQQDYQRFSENLQHRLEPDSRILGLVALGSMAGEPDPYSDHDFFVVTRPGEQEDFRTDLSWLPRSGSIVLSFRETEHGMKVVYSDGHLLEFAVFEPDELVLARINRFRILFDREHLAGRLSEVQRMTEAEKSVEASDEWLVGQFLTNLLVANGRFRRGERLSGRQFFQSAVRHFLVLVERHLPPKAPVLDNLDPLRRFEKAYPGLGPELDPLFGLDVPAAALDLLALAQRTLWQVIPREAAETVRRTLGQEA